MRALIVVDMQVGLFAGQPPRCDAEGTIARINQLIGVIRQNGRIVFIQHTEAADGLARGSNEWSLLPSLDRAVEDLVIEKTACDSFLETTLEETLRGEGIDELVIAGCATDFCVDTTIRAAAALRFKVVVPSDAHTTRDRPHLDAQSIIAHHNFMWADLLLPRRARVRVLPTQQLLAELRGAH
jgi:nicotinamidase-related amidase